MNRLILLATLLLASGSALAKVPVSVGQGVYMLSDQNFTIFGSSDGIVAKLMGKANAYCQKKGAGEAEMVDSGGTEAVPGNAKDGKLERFATGASGTIYFRCADSNIVPAALSATAGRYLQISTTGGVTNQITLDTEAACATLLAAGTSAGRLCAPTSKAGELPIRAILEDAVMHEIFVVDSVGAMTCEAFVKGLVENARLSTLQDCKAK